MYQIQAQAELERRRRIQTPPNLWPAEYVNAITGKVYQPHNEDERRFVYEDSPRHSYLKGGEGAGKSVAGIIKSLDRTRRGMNGLMVSPDLEHFKKSLWSEFVRWCPWQCVIERQRHRQHPGWEPHSTFTMVFENEVGGYSELICGGIREHEVMSWEGPNVSFVHYDEARRHKTAAALKVLSGRIRIPGPKGEPPQIFITSTPRKHWLFEYFGPEDDDDPHADFKRNSFVGKVTAEENKENLDPGYVEQRRQTLRETEARILIDAEWEDEEQSEKFVQIIWWDNCRESLPPLGRSEPMVLAMDAAKGGATMQPDCFAIAGVTRHPGRKQDVAVRYCGIWLPPKGGYLDFAQPEAELRRLCKEFSVIEVCYDSYQLHDMATRLRKEAIANFQEFSQQKPRLVADQQLQNLIMARRIAHDGNPLLRQHIDNADAVKVSGEGLRIVKRNNGLKIDSAVAVSMGTSRILYFNVA